MDKETNYQKNQQRQSLLQQLTVKTCGGVVRMLSTHTDLRAEVPIISDEDEIMIPNINRYSKSLIVKPTDFNFDNLVTAN
ncbi:hypothetical protein QVD17_16879 [Tagetes erecta]|uniref:Uncharacterized protein n=1 Tax=Tagetes erecta TaxID=13708 RepID=A0AAD8KXC9_TARER|nr:hypothetical protein QVD17_16879 [Tagetes erecta]